MNESDGRDRGFLAGERAVALVDAAVDQPGQEVAAAGLGNADFDLGAIDRVSLAGGLSLAALADVVAHGKLPVDGEQGTPVTYVSQ